MISKHRLFHLIVVVFISATLSQTIYMCFHKPLVMAVLGRRENRSTVSLQAEQFTDAHRMPGSRICSQVQRKELLHKMCETYHKLNKTVHKAVPKLIVDHKHRIAYCYIEKAGCSSWKAILANVSSGGRVKPNMTLAELRGLHYHIGSKYGLEEIHYNDSMSNYTKFMVVRHPFDRLMSSYKDKMRGGDVTFINYAKSVVEQFRTNRTNTDMFPTFQEFVTMILSNAPLSQNQHWSKYFYKCDPCNIRYDHLMKLETMDHDMDILLSKVFPGELKYITERKLNSFEPTQELKTTYKHHLNPFEELSKVQIAAISKLFEYESDFFGYRFNEDTLEADCCDQTASSEESSSTGCC